MRILNTVKPLALAVLIGLATASAQAQVEFRGTGGTNAAGDAFDAFTAFQTAAGAPPRRITWEGTEIPDNTPSVGEFPINSTTTGITTTRFAGAGAFYPVPYAVANDGFASVNPGADTTQFPAFSGTKTFAMFNTNTIEQTFVVPGAGSTEPAATRGFGAIFMDVELANTSSIEYFSGDTSLGTFFVDPGGDGEFSFLGVLFDDPIVTRVLLTLGNQNLFSFDGNAVTPGVPENLEAVEFPSDLVVVDDFVFANPQALAPEPGAGVLALLGLLPLAARLRRKK